MTTIPSGLLLAVVALLLEAVGGLVIKELRVPQYPNRGNNANLSCQFDTENENLYSVKWYKDENEFFRYMPDNRPQRQVFAQEGITLDESLSGIDHVMLTGLTFSSSGSYRCEVSLEAPEFSTAVLTHNMTVLAYPLYNPKVVGHQETYAPHDAVVVNCTAAPSNPAPHIQWTINSLQADDYLIERGPVVRNQDDTFTTSATLRFTVLEQHFLGPSGLLTLRCIAEAPPLNPVETVVEARLAGALTNEKLAQENFRKSVSGAQAVCVHLSLLPLLLSVLLVT